MLLRPVLCRPAFVSARSCCTRMPLRAKITDSAFAGQARALSTQAPPQQPGDDPEDVLFHSNYGVRTIELNRPKKLNSLDGSMVRKIVPRLMEWSKSDMANVIIMKGAGEKAFCAGGDVAVLAIQNKDGPEGQRKSKDYFAEEYKLDHLIATYTKPYIAFMDGITMGGGVGLSVHAPFRIATERTVFAMPETTIGFFPEVGGSFFLPRMDGNMGTYLALTSERLSGVNAFYHGVATHYLHSSALPDLENRLAELTFKDYADLQERFTIINATIEEFVTGLPHDQPMQLAGDVRKAIDECFAYDTIEAIIKALDSVAGSTNETLQSWATKTKKTILDRSPTSVKVTLKEMQLGKNWTIDQAFQREYHIASVFMEGQDFIEGVSARLIRKPAETPQWQPATIDGVSMDDVDRYFTTRGQEHLQLYNRGPSATYLRYPHAWIGLPTEKDVQEFVEQGGKGRKDVLKHFYQLKEGKLGVKEKVTEILARKTTVQEGSLVWDFVEHDANNSRGSRDSNNRR